MRLRTLRNPSATTKRELTMAAGNATNCALAGSLAHAKHQEHNESEQSNKTPHCFVKCRLVFSMSTRLAVLSAADKFYEFQIVTEKVEDLQALN